jgi:uncharacterized membrane protein YfcA
VVSASDGLAIPLGLVAGLAATLFGGAGVGAIAQPGLRTLGVGPIGVIGTSVTIIFPSALLSTIRYRGSGLIQAGAVITVALAGIPVAVAGALLTNRIPGHGHAQQLFIAALLIAGASRMLWSSRADPAGESRPARAIAPTTRRRRLAGIGLVAGTFSGALGLSGGMVVVPALTELVGFPARHAVASSTLIVALLAVPSVITHAALGHIDWTLAGLLTLGVVPGVVIGSSITLRSHDRTIRHLFGGALLLLGLVYAAGELVALV